MARIIDNVRLPEDIEQGAQIGPSFSTSIIKLANGKTDSNSNWQDCLFSIDCGYGIMDRTDPDEREHGYMEILNFYMARKGPHRGFLFKNMIDYEATLEPLALISEIDRTYQLGITYDEYFRKITRPEPETLILINNNVQLTEEEYTLGELGQITIVEEIEVNNLIATFEFCLPVYFEADELLASITHIRAGEIPNIKLLQIQE